MGNICSPRTSSAVRAAIARATPIYRDFTAEHRRLQQERVAAFKEFAADVEGGAYPGPEHAVPIADDESFMEQLRDC